MLVLSTTGGSVFFHSGVSIVRVGRKKLDVDKLYKKLDVDPNASSQEIKAAAKKAMLESHPDHGGDEEEFIEIRQAYEILSDPASRAAYDDKDRELPFSRKVFCEKPREEPVIAPTRSAYYKEPDIVMTQQDEEEVSLWIEFLLEAARVRKIEKEIKVAVKKKVPKVYELSEEGLYVIEKGKAQKYMAYVLMTLESKGKENGYKCS